MAKRCNHYDVAFEHLLRMVRRPYVSVNENRRALFQDSSLKSMDFVVYSQQTTNLLVDVKGRRFTAGGRTWDSWTSQEDVASLMQWEQVFGSGFRGLFVFAYEVPALRDTARHSLVWELKGRRYAFYGIWAEDYSRSMRVRSRSWQTVSLPARDFRRLRQPLLDVL
ncbi:HYExAFE family protein [Planctomicrobium sp. SH664]|uniref:HYExAFE family protein n=1 Tax=Planctomicrobium sp. SH664 TaxID=3448125 RepID=UPI003F5BD4AD